MTFIKSIATLATAAVLFTACSDSNTDHSKTENTLTNQASTAESAPETATTTQAAASAPAAESVPSPEFADLPAPYSDADFARGKRIFRQCSSCHMVSADGGNLVGPNLYGMFSRKVGASEGFAYSTALQEADFDWTPEQLNQWLESPRSFLPGNRMTFAGVRKQEDRDAVIAYLMVESGWSAE